MRSYPHNSPEAAARIVALAMLADGHLSRSEMDMLTRIDAPRVLGMTPEALQSVVHTFCNDVLSTSDHAWGQAFQVDERTLRTLLDEVSDASLRTRVLHLCMELIEADDHVADGETQLMLTALEHWSQPMPARAPEAVCH